jgi:DNA-binding transcriptional LysR family regulator
MTIEQLQFFLMIKDLKNFTDAANELYISQSTLSKQIKALENELGLQLFERTTRKIRITPGGEVFSQYAQRVITEYHEIMLKIKQYQQESSIINIASIPELETYNLIEIINGFAKENPNILIEIEEGDRQNALNELRKGMIDIAIVRNYFIDKVEFNTVPIFRDELVLLVPNTHPLAERGKISLAEVSRETFVFLPRNTGIYTFCIEECKKAGFYPHTKRDQLCLSSIFGEVMRGEGITLVANTVAEKNIRPGISILLLEEQPLIDLCFVLRKEKISGHCENLIRFVRKQLGSAEEDKNQN